jgi:hypothetical protein
MIAISPPVLIFLLMLSGLVPMPLKVALVALAISR